MACTRRNLTNPEEWWAAFERAAQAAGRTLSEWIGDCCRRRLPPEDRRALPDRPPAHRPPGK